MNPIHWRDVALDSWPCAHFKPEELACKGDGLILVVPEFLHRLERLRVAFGKPIVINSGYRSPAYNAQVAHTGSDGPHTTGRAVDIAIRGADALALIGLAIKEGFTGFGVSQVGDSRFLHLDDLPPIEGRPRPTLWSY